MGKLARTRLNLVEQAHVLNRDHGLIGEISDQLDLLFTECPNLLSVDGDRADELMLVEHRDNDERSGTTKFGGSDEIRIALDPDLLLRPGIEDVNRLFRPRDTAKTASRIRDKWSTLQELGKRRRYAEHRSGLDKVIVETEKHSEIGFANSRRPLQHGLEYGLELAGRTRDDAEHLGGRRQLLPRLGQLPLRLRKSAFEIGSGFLRHRGRSHAACRLLIRLTRGRIKTYAMLGNRS